jgi:hypothetical protein
MTATQPQQTLADLLALGGGHLPPGWDARAHALLLTDAAAAALKAAQPDKLQHRIQPINVTGWPPHGIGADVLAEAEGIFLPIFQVLDRTLAADVLVVSWDEFVSRIPVVADPDSPAPNPTPPAP